MIKVIGQLIEASSHWSLLTIRELTFDYLAKSFEIGLIGDRVEKFDTNERNAASPHTMAFLEKLEWVPASGGECPEDAVHAGIDSGCKVFVARVHHDNGMIIPGKLHQSHSCVYIPYNMQEVSVKEYEVLCGPPACLSWVDASGSEIPEHAVPGGHEADGEIMYIGRVIHNGTVTVGKVHPSHGTCYVPYGGQELAFEEYEILVKNKLGLVLQV